MSAAALEFSQDEHAITVSMDRDITLRFALHHGWLLGLQQASSQGTPLSSEQTVLRPVIAQEFPELHLWPYMRLRSVEHHNGAIVITCDLYGQRQPSWRDQEFVLAANPQPSNTPTMDALGPEIEQARSLLDPLIDDHDDLTNMRSRMARLEAFMAEYPQGSHEYVSRHHHLRRLQQRLRQRSDELAMQHAADNDRQREAVATLKRWQQAVKQASIEQSIIHRDYYAFAHLRLPADSCRKEALQQRLDDHNDALDHGGRITWTLRPRQRVIAGWQWRGWSQSFQVDLHEGYQSNVFRQVGTWEIGGHAAGMTVINMRYRGLGGIIETLAGDQENGVHRAWSTTEMLPGAAGSSPVVSPAIAEAGDNDLSDRAYAMRHRLDAWISKMARGAGTGFVDFQHRDGLSFISFHEDQGALRALSEIFPGDHFLSQTDEQWFPNSQSFATQEQWYLSLHGPDGQHEMLSRWQEVDQYVRDRVSERMGFVQIEPLPAVGWMRELRRPEFYRWKAEEGVHLWHDLGVRTVITHTPGWHTEQHRDGPHEPATYVRYGPGGNSNRVFDWVITDDVAEDWRRFQEISEQKGMTYHIYLGGMVRRDGPFAKTIGQDPALWGMNKPGLDYSHGYPPLLGHNLYAEGTRDLLRQRLLDVRDQLGAQGLWCDSWQNMYMSQLNWGDGSGAPMQSAWWSLMAELSREGLHLMAESHAFPGLSCSIEVAGWEEAYYCFPMVVKWHRGTSQQRYSAEQHNHMSFRFMANKAWLAPDEDPLVIPDYPRLSAEYRTALPSMHRSSVLPQGRGVLWRPYGVDDHGIWFSFAAGEVPAGVQASYILATPERNTQEVQQHRTYRVQGDDLLEAFGMAAPPLPDQRQRSSSFAAEPYRYPTQAR